MTNSKMYTDEEMIEEIKECVEELGGFIRYVEGQLGQGSGLQLYVGPDLVEQASTLVNDIRLKYDKRRRKIRKDSPFAGVEQFLN
jgi:hypothetical protein